MVYTCLKDLEPAAFFRWFGEIAAIPHGSRKEQQLIAFLQRFAADRALPCHTDAAGNVLMRVPAHKDYVNQPAVLFQAHMDMIWEKDEGVVFDFETQALDLCVDGDRLLAKGTTLGADNAVGMATMLALADDPDLPHPELELLFTVAEEVGMVGIRAVDPATIHARRMVNMDCGDSHVLCVSSASKNDMGIDRQFDLHPAQWQGLRVTISDGLSGHPGLAANLGRCCAVNAMGDLLQALSEFQLGSIRASQAICATCEAVIAAPEGASDALQAQFAWIAQVYAKTDPNITLTVAPCEIDRLLSPADSRLVALALRQLRTGQLRCDGNAPQNIVTSGCITAASLEDGKFTLRYRLRSSIEGDSRLQFARFCEQLQPFGFHIHTLDSYSGWLEREDSAFRKKFLRIHKDLFGYDMELERCSGGIETGILLQSIPDMDAIGIAPTARGAHTTREYLSISETLPYWQLVLAVLAERE